MEAEGRGGGWGEMSFDIYFRLLIFYCKYSIILNFDLCITAFLNDLFMEELPLNLHIFF